MKILLVAGLAVLSLLFASADHVGSPVRGDTLAFAEGVTAQSPR